MKKFFAVFLGALSAIFCLVFSACDGVKIQADDVGLLTSDEVVAIRAERTVSEASLFDALTYLQGGVFEFTYDTGDYGAYLLTVNGRSCGANEFWAIYTSLTEYEGVTYSSAEWGVYDYNGQSLQSASYGVSGLPLVEGAIYLIARSSY